MKWLLPAAVALAGALWAPCVWAHAALLAATPADGASLAAAPGAVVLDFDEPVGALAMRLVDATGASLDLTAEAHGPQLRIALPAKLREGSYVFSYRVVSADAHPVAGSLAFTVGAAPPAVAAPSVAPSDAALDTGWFVVRALRDVALLVAGGTALFVLLIGAFPFQRRVLVLGGVATVLLAGVGLALQGAALAGVPLRSVGAIRAALAAAGSTSAGAAALCGIVAGLAVAIGAVLSSPRARTLLLVVGALALPASLALTGHAAAAQPAWASMTVLALHALAAAFWAGSLLALWLLLRRNDAAALPALRRFSSLATIAVALLLAAGVAFSALQLQAVRDLVETRYGQLILAKAALLLVLLLIAARNRYALVPRLERDVARGAGALRRAIGLEMALVAAAVAVAAVLTGTSPHLHAAAAAPATGSAPAAPNLVVDLTGAPGYQGRLTLVPGQRGHNIFNVELRRRDGPPLDPAEASLRLRNTGAGIEAIDRPLRRTGPGSYRYEGGELAFPGAWDVTVRARIGDFEQIELRATVTLR